MRRWRRRQEEKGEGDREREKKDERKGKIDETGREQRDKCGACTMKKVAKNAEKLMIEEAEGGQIMSTLI